jgi:ferredoxin
MIAVDQNVFYDFLVRHDEKQWTEVVHCLLPSIHPVDQLATRIWFSFWPLKLARELQASADVTQTAKRLQLDGEYRLERQVDSSVKHFLGSRYWRGVKQAVIEHAESMGQLEAVSLERQIRLIASKVAAAESVEEPFILGITAVGVMILQQIGIAAFAAVVHQSFEIKNHKSVDQLIRSRNGKSGRGFWGLLGLPSKTHQVTFDESQPDCAFHALNGQDLSMASSTDHRDYKSRDHRRIAGPVPAECRSGACGYCRIGVIGGRENLSEITDFEKKRLRHFGYIAGDQEIERHPHVRLACQSKCYGNVSIVIPPWNGVLGAKS